jgi:hypothetical protein
MLIAVWKPKSNWAIRMVFITLVILFLLLAISEWCADTGYADSSNKINTAAGAVGILCGVDAFYIALAEAVNNCYGSTILPLGEVLPPKEAEPASPPPVIAGHVYFLLSFPLAFPFLLFFIFFSFLLCVLDHLDCSVSAQRLPCSILPSSFFTVLFACMI